jgi:copper(I)-binding protein
MIRPLAGSIEIYLFRKLLMFLRLGFATFLIASSSAFALDYKVANLRIDHPSARATKPGQPGAAAYMMIENNGKQPERLIGAHAPIAKKTEIHSMIMDGNVMKMREVASIEIKPQTTVVMQPGDGYHIMLSGLSKPLKAGDQFPLTLTFEKAGKVEVSVSIEDKIANAKKPQAGAVGHAHHHKH